MTIILGGLISGFVFGVGLVISGMTQPSKVLGFLDVLGVWDPTLAFVMAGALMVAAPGFYFARRRERPLFAGHFRWPQRADIDRPLVAGSAMFGVGWGLVGLCPGPAIANLATLMPQVLIFLAAMAAGMLAIDLWRRHSGARVATDAA
jgi:uncharacterized membrane protein YedE/YeeE